MGIAHDERRRRVRQKRVVLAVVATVKLSRRCIDPTGIDASSIRGATEAKGIRLRGDHAISRKTTAQGRPGVSGSTCVSSVHHCASVQHRGRGCRPAPGLPCALFLERGEGDKQSSGRTCRENADACSLFEIWIGRRNWRHCEERSDEAIQTVSADAFLDCFAALAMTEKGPRAELHHPHAEEPRWRGRLEARGPPAGPSSFETPGTDDRCASHPQFSSLLPSRWSGLITSSGSACATGCDAPAISGPISRPWPRIRRS